MRKLLVASQKGGVGKTATSMNLAAVAALSGTRVLLLDADPLSNISTALRLAEHPRRRPLRPDGIDLPGVLVPDIVPRLDVLSPYDEGRCFDDDFARLLRVVEAATPQCYGCMIVDAPPFLGGNPAPLIASCDDFLLVMRAEALAYRTLPAFLELVQRSSSAGRALPMCGIVLTLPEGEVPGGRWERELRGRFGTRVLPQVVPHDESFAQALLAGQIGCHLHPDSPAARQYRQLAGKLGLAGEDSAVVEGGQIVRLLRAAAPLLEPTVAPAAGTIPAPAVVPCEIKRPSGKAPPLHRPRRLSRSGERLRSARPERVLPPPAVPPSPLRIKVVPAQVPNDDEIDPRPAVPAAPPQPTANALAQLWPLWILLGAVLGGGLRLVPLTPSLLPILVGLGVALLVVVLLFSLAAQERRDSPNPASQPNQAAPRPSKDSLSVRLASLASLSKRGGRDPDAN